MPLKKVWWVLAGVLVGVGGLVLWGIADPVGPSVESGITYFYGDGCPHCKTVQEYLDREHIAEKVLFQKKEVWKNRTNARAMERAAKICGVQQEGMGVPFVFDAEAQKCYVGEPDAIGFFEEKAKMGAAETK